MIRREYTVRFVTPAFLGGADQSAQWHQSAQWRTPPFKALLRQWWRVVYAARNEFRVNVQDMRRDEGLLFGNAWLQDNFCKSRVRIRLDQWRDGQETKAKWGQRELQANWKVPHPEIRQHIGPMLYLGYGPLAVEQVKRSHQQRGDYATVLKTNAAIQAGEAAKLSIAVPDDQSKDIQIALALMNLYGTVGGRSRNGWGSFSLTATSKETPELDGLLDWSLMHIWYEALGLDWPHAIGKDETGPLIWQTAKAYDDWKSLMRDLAVLKIGLRTQFVFTSGNRSPQPEARHWLSYPVTKHSVQGWGNARLPNSLRFKARPDSEHGKKLRGVMFHVPCLPPRRFTPNRAAIESVWQRVHELLDEVTIPAGDRQYGMIADAARRRQLEPLLNGILLERAKA